MGLTFCSHGQPFELFVTVDSSFNCYSDSKSHTGVTVHLGRFSGVVMSFCGKQSIIVDSSTVAEFIGAHQACKINTWVRNLLSGMDDKLTQPPTLFRTIKQLFVSYIIKVMKLLQNTLHFVTI